MEQTNINISDYMKKHVHFVGIGGCSMSGLAGLLSQLGCRITGSDNTASHTTDKLVSLGIPVAIGHAVEHVHGADLLVYSAAIGKNAPERAEAERLGIPQLERIVLLGQIMQWHKTAIGISGTHGKTTATAMLSQILLNAGLDPTIHIGGDVDFLGGSTRYGKSDYIICEACEFNAGFLQLRPSLAVVLNIEEDHLDYYRDLQHIKDTFEEFVALVPDDGFCVGFGDDELVSDILSRAKCNTITFGLGVSNDIRAESLSYDKLGRGNFTATCNGKTLCTVSLSVGGEYNVINALATIAACFALSVPMDSVGKTLSSFTNPHRRFELTGTRNGAAYYHDYGHHPTAVQNVLSVAKKQPHKTLYAVQQPHTYSRTKALMKEFSMCFDDADVILVTDIHGAREVDPGDVHATELVDLLRKHGKKTIYTPNFSDAKAYLLENAGDGDLVITLGCGNVYLLNELMLTDE